MRLLQSLLFQTMEQLLRQLDLDELEKGEEWRHRPRVGQEWRIYRRISRYFEDYLEGRSDQVPWLKIMGLCHIALVRELRPDLLLPPNSHP